MGGILAGRIAITLHPMFGIAPWILALFPPVLSVRGSIGGILSGKLATMLHMGEVEPRLTRNTQEFYSLIQGIFVLTFIDGVGIGVLAFIVNVVSGSATLNHFLYFMIVPVLACLITMVVATPVAHLVGIEAFKKGMDPDIILYPMMSTIDDVLLTVCYIAVVSVVLVPGSLTAALVILLLTGAFFLVIFLRQRKATAFRRILAEGAPIVILSSLLGTFSGVGLASLKDEIERHPTVLILYPALIDTLGDIGSIIGSMETTKLALGFSRSFMGVLKETLVDLISVESAAAMVHVLFGLVAFLVGQGTGLNPNLVLLVTIAILTNLVSFMFVSLFSIVIAAQTFKYGLDPDNFVIPLVTSVSDVIATLALITALVILAV